MSDSVTAPEVEITKTTGKRGRPADTTPNKEFAAKKILDNEDNTSVYKISYNDENGIRHTRLETRPTGRKGGKGRQPDRIPKKILTPKFSRGDEGTLTLNVPFNGLDGIRREGVVTLSVNSDGELSATVS